MRDAEYFSWQRSTGVRLALASAMATCSTPSSHQALQLQDRLLRLGSQSVVVPVVPGTKRPAVKHNGRHTWTAANAYTWFRGNKAGDVGILLQSELVLDFDDKDSFFATRRLFPELARAPTETTRRGVHVFFRRSSALDAAGFSDCPLKDPATGASLKIDAKTVTNSDVEGVKTRGLLVVAPTAGRQWLPGLSLMKVDPPEPSAALVAWLLERGKTKRSGGAAREGGGSSNRKKEKPGSSSRRAAAGGDATAVVVDLDKHEGQPYLLPTPEIDAIDAVRAGGFRIVDAYSAQRAQWLPKPGGSKLEYDLASDYLWKDVGVSPCPLCGKVNHVNSYRMLYQIGSGSRSIDNMSADCNPRWKALPFSAESNAAIRPLFETQCEAVPSEKVAALAGWAARHRPDLAPLVGLGFSLGRWLFFRAAGGLAYLVIGKPSKHAPFFTFRIDETPWHGSRKERTGVADVPFPEHAASTTELGDIIYMQPSTSVENMSASEAGASGATTA